MKYNRSLFSVLLIALALLLFVGVNEVSAIAIEPQAEGSILYVKPGANGTCTSWEDACELQTALLNAVDGDQIWVAAGTYKPSNDTNREATFQLKSGVAIYGGFPAAGGEWYQRNWVFNLTTLSGDIGLTDNNSDNSYHVVTGGRLDGTADLDGFTITGGNANGSMPNNGGGGFYNSGGSPTLNNVTFTDNSAGNYGTGGGMYNNDGNPTLINVTFLSNSAHGIYHYGFGGGMFNESSSPTLTNVTFSGNSAGQGGGVYNKGGNPILTNVTFLSNSVLGFPDNAQGGGMYNESSNPTLTDVTFSSNSATGRQEVCGGGMYNDSSSPTLTNVTFSGNSVLTDRWYSSYGGGLYNDASSNPTLNDVTFSSNSTLGYVTAGGGLYNSGNNASLTNVTFSGNSAAGHGGGLYNSGSSLTLTNVTFSGNTAFHTVNDYHGGGMYNFYGNPTLINVTFSGNSAEDGGGMYNHYGSPILINVTFSSNTSLSQGGGMKGFGGNPSLTNVTFSGNSSGSGGGMYNSNSSPTLTNVTFVENTARNYGGGMRNEDPSRPTLINAILWGNTPQPQIYGSANVSYSLISTPNPLLGPLTDNGGFTQTHALLEGSPAIDTGSPTVCPVIDQRAFTRPIDGDEDGIPRCDIGAYEYNSYPATFSLSTQVFGNGLLTINPDKTEYLFGEVVTLTATADPDWVFIGWSGDASGLVNPLTVTIFESTNITASFAYHLSSLIVSVTPELSGSVRLNPDLPIYPTLSQVTMTAEAEHGWTFAGWSGDASGTENPLTITILEDTNINASFTQDDYILSVVAAPMSSGSVIVEPLQATYHYGDQVILTAVANADHSFLDWSGDASGSVNPHTVTITGNTSINANFDCFLAMSVAPEGSGNVVVYPDQPYYRYGDQVTITAFPNAGWSFASWSGDASGTSSQIIVSMDDNLEITANFSQNQYSLIVSVNPSGTGTVTRLPNKPTYVYGDVVTLTPFANPGWTFSSWTGNATGSNNPLTVTITGNTSITANFTQDEYTLSVLVDPSDKGSVTIDPVKSTYHYGDMVILTAIATTPSWAFTGWTGDVTGTDNPLTITVIGDTSITAIFSDQFSLETIVDPDNSGSVFRDLDKDIYQYSDVVTLTPIANPGWTFTGWSGDASGTNNPLTITIQGNTSVTANFTQDEYTLNVTVVGSGTVALTPDQDTYHYNEVVTLTPTADPGWTFTGWSGAEVTDNLLTITGNTSITATFTQDEYTLTVTPIGSGTVAIDPVQATYHYGDIVTLTPSANPGWTFTGWSGAEITDNQLIITGNTNITATFTQDEYTLTVTPIGSGTVAVDPLQTTYHYGDIVTLTPTANSGWTFFGWGEAGTTNPLIVTITGNTNITATFTQDEYTLTVTPVGSGTVEIDPVQETYHYGDVVTLTPTDNPGWTFSSWGGDASGTDNPLTVIIQGDTNITANFTQDEYTLTVTLVGSGTVEIDPVQETYHYGDAVTLTATADPGWTFIGWSGDASGLDNPLTHTIVSNTIITATFTQDEYTLTVTTVGSGTVAIDPVQDTYHYGDIVTLTPTANPGWTFAGWSGAEVIDNQLTITGNTTVTATFTQDEYTLTVTPVGSGSVAIDPVQDTYHYGDIVTLTPTADPGWTFLGWGGDASGSENPLTYTILGNTSITATFTQDEYTLTVAPVGSGTVAVDPLQTTYHYGDIVTLTPTANLGWTFSGWGDDASGLDNPLTYTIVGNTTITATFIQDEYTLSVTPIGSGTVTVDPLQDTYHYGDVVTLTPTADPGWTFFGWGGDASGSENPLTYTILVNTSITANFTQDEYTLSVVVDPVDSGTVAIDPLQDTYHYGDLVTLTPTTDLGWTFTGWSGDATGTDNPLTITVQGDTSITANFTDQYALIVEINPSSSGNVMLDPEQATYQYGSQVTLTPVSNPGWYFSGWSGDATGLDNPLSVTIEGDTKITANFMQLSYIYLPLTMRN